MWHGSLSRQNTNVVAALCCLQLRFFKTISVKEMEANFVRMKVPELKNNLQVWGISVTNKRCEERLDFNFSWITVEAREQVIEI